MSQIKKKFDIDEYKVSYSVTLPDHNKRLDQFLKKHFLTFSREQIKKKIEAGDISIPQKTQKLKSSTKIKEGETVLISTKRSDFPSELWRGKEIPLKEEIDVIYEDDNYIVINKPPFMSTHPTGKHLFYCATVILEHLKDSRFYSVHRLDRETSGILILSKEIEASRKLTQLFEERKIQKIYFVISHKKVKRKELPFVATERLGQKKDFIPELFTHCFPEKSAEGKSAKTSFHLIQDFENYTLLLAIPLTGRQHQIRAHAAFHGYPLLGDKLYNGDPLTFTRFKDQIPAEKDFDKMQIPRHALHAISLKIPAPYDSIYTANVPEDLVKWIEEHLSFSSKALHKNIQDKLGVIWDQMKRSKKD